ncbi:MAG: Do family serine endopeptidase [Nitrospirota bacterium]|jgi:serine protease Do
MKTKAFIGAALLLSGFVLGALALQFLPAKPQYQPPPQRVVVPRAAGEVIEASKAFSQVVNSVSPAVVNISTVKLVARSRSGFKDDPFYDFFNDFFNPFYDYGLDRDWKEQSLGSGVLVSGDGYIITNNHVVSNAEKIRVTLYDKRVFSGRVIGADPKTDIAVVKISAGGLPVIPWGDSDRLQVGEFVLAIGNPFGLSHTVTMGIISAVGRANVGIADYEDFIQTDAAINPGNSGGPLVGIDGDLIGINTAIFSQSGGYQGIGFAVPANMARSIMDQLIREGKVVRGWLGVTVQELTPEIARKFGHGNVTGALVGEALEGSPADRGGLRSGDIIFKYDGEDVGGPAELKNMVAKSPPGDEVPLGVLRDRKRLRITVTIGERPGGDERPRARPASETEGNVFSGLNVITLTPDIARQLDLDGDEAGVVAVGVRVGSPAEEAGLKRGDLIQAIDRMPVKDAEDFERIAAGIRAEETVLMFLNRGGRKFYITIQAGG